MATPLPSQDRSRARREALLRAAITLLGEGGARAVTHRAVAAAAGVPPAATTYYFSSIQQLTEEALRLHVEERIEELHALAAQAVSGGGGVEAVAARFVDVLIARDTVGTVAQFEVFLEAARNPALRDAVIDSLTAFEELATAVLTSFGARRPAEAAASVVAVINGFALNRIARPTPDDAANLLEALRPMLMVQLMTDEQLEPLRRQLALPPGQLT